MAKAAIKVEDISKSFKLPHEKQSSLKGALINFRKRGYEKQEVLRNINFEIQQGEFFGIVGRNGSGKSTLLKLLAGIYTPDSGNIQVNGKLTPFIELGVGFNPELTGRENVFLNGALLGFNRKDMEALYDEIVDFAELERFMDQKLKNYSSGMQVRLAFSIAIRAQSDILLIDEVLAVGDANFQQKCYKYFYNLKKNKQTVVLVTHDMGAVKEFCDRAILVHDGDLVAMGTANEIALKYTVLNSEDRNNEANDQGEKNWGTKRAEITSCVIKTPPRSDKFFVPNEMIDIQVSLRAREKVDHPIVGITIKDQAEREICVTNTKALEIKTPVLQKGDLLTLTFSIENIFNDGIYTLTAGAMDATLTEFLNVIEEAMTFEVRGWSFPTGIAHPNVHVKLATSRKVKKSLRDESKV